MLAALLNRSESATRKATDRLEVTNMPIISNAMFLLSELIANAEEKAKIK